MELHLDLGLVETNSYTNTLWSAGISTLDVLREIQRPRCHMILKQRLIWVLLVLFSSPWPELFTIPSQHACMQDLVLFVVTFIQARCDYVMDYTKTVFFCRQLSFFSYLSAHLIKLLEGIWCGQKTLEMMEKEIDKQINKARSKARKKKGTVFVLWHRRRHGLYAIVQHGQIALSSFVLVTDSNTDVPHARQSASSNDSNINNFATPQLIIKLPLCSTTHAFLGNTQYLVTILLYISYFSPPYPDMSEQKTVEYALCEPKHLDYTRGFQEIFRTAAVKNTNLLALPITHLAIFEKKLRSMIHDYCINKDVLNSCDYAIIPYSYPSNTYVTIRQVRK